MCSAADDFLANAIANDQELQKMNELVARMDPVSRKLFFDDLKKAASSAMDKAKSLGDAALSSASDVAKKALAAGKSVAGTAAAALKGLEASSATRFSSISALVLASSLTWLVGF